MCAGVNTIYTIKISPNGDVLGLFIKSTALETKDPLFTGGVL